MKYFALDQIDLDLGFSQKEIEEFIEMWQSEISLLNISKKMKRKKIELAILVIDLAERKKIKQRKQGLDGL
ncbi:hypothetical protein [Paenisporosarcina cavernae]|uniref:Uncharacterized protein n=1 Tax=Paenisporosarcina cavernae TaxID=2320858 RepID=A0A385YVW0_9BACL|nr:hypothetical protein [Paenisporosarcina cavernae]AYC29653.1 hypothetical protein D3873_07030 [Paenisporosarcina cavernae]AYC30017.1 hypothetical protein D3873_09085 [Paenisporosarcina cavernae]